MKGSILFQEDKKEKAVISIEITAFSLVGGGGGNRTRVRKLSAQGFYMLSL